MNKQLSYLVLLTLLSIGIGLIPTIQHGVPPGYVDTAAHIATGLDVREGNFDSLLHKWWHRKNHVLYQEERIVDRYITTFFYPPLLHLLLAFTYIFLPIAFGTGLLISTLYALSVPALYFVLRSHGIPEKESLLAGAIMAVSTTLLISQNNGFWTFIIALNFSLLAYASTRFQKVIPAILFALLAVLTHWVFFLAICVIYSIEWLYRKNQSVKNIALVSLSTSSVLLLATVLISDWPYLGTSHPVIHIENIFLLVPAIIGAWYARKQFPEIIFYATVTLLIMFSHAINILFIFADMAQYALVYFIAAFCAIGLSATVQRKRKALLLFTSIGILVTLFSTVQLTMSTQPSITSEQLEQLIHIRAQTEITEQTILVWDADIHPAWSVLVAKRKLMYPFEDTESVASKHVAYLEYQRHTAERVFVREQNNTLYTYMAKQI